MDLNICSDSIKQKELLPERCLFGIEGNSGVGKSTLTKGLNEIFKQTLCYPELGKYLDVQSGDVLPKYPPVSQDEVDFENCVWIRAEIRRQSARDEAARSNTIVFFDIVDTTSLSVLAYEIAKAVFNEIDGTEQLAQKYTELFEKQELDQPTRWIFLEANPELIYNRLACRGETRKFLFNTAAMVTTERIRSFFYSNYLSSKDYLVLVNENISPNELIEKASMFVADNFLGKTNTVGLAKFVSDLINPKFFEDFIRYLKNQ